MFVARSNVAALPKLYENLIFNRQILSFPIELNILSSNRTHLEKFQ